MRRLFYMGLALGLLSACASDTGALAECSICKWKGSEYSEGARLTTSCFNKACTTVRCTKGKWENHSTCTEGMNCPPLAP